MSYSYLCMYNLAVDDVDDVDDAGDVEDLELYLTHAVFYPVSSESACREISTCVE
jgi:hypothetical protein